MSYKLKLLLVFLVLATGIAAFEFADLLHTLNFRVSLPTLLSDLESLDTISDDTDGDGLKDTEESYWNTDFQNPDTDGDGFLDGEEVASGHNPTQKGPDDKIIIDGTPQNVTKKISGLVLAGLVEGSLKEGSLNRDRSVDQLVDEILYQTAINSRVGEQNTLFIIPNTEENEKKYAQQMSPLLETIAREDPYGITRFAKALEILVKTDDDTHPDFVNFFETEIPFIENQITQLNMIQVPENWADAHNELMFTLRKARAYYVLLQQTKEDPFQANVVIERLITLMTEPLVAIMVKYSSIHIPQ